MTSKDLARTFTHCELYFASPTQFNDPFDCCPPFSITDYTDNDLIDHFRKAFSSICPHISDPELEAIIGKRVASIVQNDLFKSDIVAPFISSCHEVNRELGVLCLSEVPDDILMWSHYADGHRGVVLQFDKSILESAFGACSCKQVDCKNNILTLREINGANPDELVRLLLLKKANRWEYEKEWRIIIDPSLNKLIPNCRIDRFPKDALTGVIFGAEMAPEDQYTVHMWLKDGSHQAQIYKAMRETGSYSLKINPPL